MTENKTKTRVQKLTEKGFSVITWNDSAYVRVSYIPSEGVFAHMATIPESFQDEGKYKEYTAPRDIVIAARCGRLDEIKQWSEMLFLDSYPSIGE